jgi:hypothetical protein
LIGETSVETTRDHEWPTNAGVVVLSKTNQSETSPSDLGGNIGLLLSIDRER